jgi:hypothetical protein
LFTLSSFIDGYTKAVASLLCVFYIWILLDVANHGFAADPFSNKFIVPPEKLPAIGSILPTTESQISLLIAHAHCPSSVGGCTGDPRGRKIAAFLVFLFSLAIVLTQRGYISRLTPIEVHLKPETEFRLNELASRSGLPTDDLMEDAMAGYLQEVTEVRQMLDSRYDDIKSGRVKPVEGEVFFESLRQREDELLKNRSPK